MTAEQRRELIESGNTRISITRQCELIGLARSSYYNKPRGESEYNKMLMKLIDRIYTKHPFFGVPKITETLNKTGHKVNPKRIERLMRMMGLAAICPKKRTSIPDKDARKYPYLLGNLSIERPNQVWATDITYIRMRRGFAYLVAVMDWFSRYVISWRLSVFMDVEFCIEALDAALARARPEIFNSDQGSQFTSEAFTARLAAKGVAISMDGRGRYRDNIYIERLWRSVKYEEVYLKDYSDVWEAQSQLAAYFQFYNNRRPHQALAYRTPAQVYCN